MSITVVGPIAFDAVRTPFGARERMLGGAAVHAALAASLFDDVHVVAAVGEDFGADDLALLATRGTDVSDVAHVEGARTPTWRGKYGWDFHERQTLDAVPCLPQAFAPQLSAAACACDVLLVADLPPAATLSVLDHCDRRRVAAVELSERRLEGARDLWLDVLARADVVLLGAADLRELTGRPTVVGAARALVALGPSVVVVKQGEHGAAAITADRFFALPAYPLESVVDPTGAVDAFAGGFVGALAADAAHASDAASVRQAMAFATALAAFAVEAFGAERVVALHREEVDARVRELWDLTHFDPAPPRKGPQHV